VEAASQSPENGSRLCKYSSWGGRKEASGGSGSQSPENGSRLCKLRGWLAVFLDRQVSQSPENGSRLCKAMARKTERKKTGATSQSPENGSRLCKTADQFAQLIINFLDRRNPLRTGLGSARLMDLISQVVQALDLGRNPLRTGLGSARHPGRSPHPQVRSESQSPENGSRLCKAARGVPVLRRSFMPSQSPENGSRLCKVSRERDLQSAGARRNPLRTGLGSASIQIQPDGDLPRLVLVAIP